MNLVYIYSYKFCLYQLTLNFRYHLPLRYRVDEFIPRRRLTANPRQTLHYTLETPRHNLNRMRAHPPTIHNRLHRRKRTGAKRPILRRRLAAKVAPQHDFAAPDGHDVEPGGLHGAGARLRDRLAEGFDGDVAAAGTPDGAVAELCCFCFRDAVQRVGELVARVPPDVVRAGGAVVVEDFLGAEACDEVEVGEGGGGDGAEAGSVRGERFVQPKMSMLIKYLRGNELRRH